MTQASPPSSEKRPGRFVIGIVVLLGLVGIVAFGILQNGKDDPEQSEVTPEKQPAIEDPKPEPVVEEPPRDSFIPGLAAVDVYGKLERNGFKIKKTNEEDLVIWTCEDNVNPDTTYRAKITARNEDQLMSVTGTVVNFGSDTTENVAKPFLDFFVALPHAESQPNAALKWLAGHVNQIGATTKFGEVAYTISGDERTRVLQLRHEPSTP